MIWPEFSVHHRELLCAPSPLSSSLCFDHQATGKCPGTPHGQSKPGRVILICHVFIMLHINLQYWYFLAVEDDEYFHIERMIAISSVNGGQGPCCLSPNLFLFLIGKVKAIEAPIDNIPKDEVKKALLEVPSWAGISNFNKYWYNTAEKYLVWLYCNRGLPCG